MYQDPNASVMFQMVEPLRGVQQVVTTLLEEWPDHPGLQKILDITNTLLTLPLSTPLSKVSHFYCYVPIIIPDNLFIFINLIVLPSSFACELRSRCSGCNF